MPRRSRKVLEARYREAERQFGELLWMGPVEELDLDTLRWVDQWVAMTDEQIDAYYRTPEGQAELAEELASQREADQRIARLEAIPVEKRPNPLGRRLLRRGVLDFYGEIMTRVIKGVPRKQIAKELGVSVNRVKMALRALRLLSGQSYASHNHKDKDPNKCPQCRSYLNQGPKAYSDTDPRRLKKKRELPEEDKRLDWLANLDDDGHPRTAKKPTYG